MLQVNKEAAMIRIGFNKDESEIPVDFSVYRKKPVTVFAAPVDDEFEVNTLHGAVKGNKGDYLVMGVEFEMYPVKREIFEKTFEYADEKSNALDKVQE
jgi:hypothetical protein